MPKTLSEAQKTRIKAGRLLQKGLTPTQIAAEVGVARQTVHTWKRILEDQGFDALKNVPEVGRPAQLSESDMQWLAGALREGATAHGFGTDLWTLKRVNALIRKKFGATFSDVHVWRLLGKLGFSSQKPERQAKERDESAVQNWREKIWPKIKKKPAKKVV